MPGGGVLGDRRQVLAERLPRKLRDATDEERPQAHFMRYAQSVQQHIRGLAKAWLGPP